MSAIVALQVALRTRLIGSPGVTDLVPEEAILDRHARPAPDPSIILGEHQALPYGDIARRVLSIDSTLHIWKKEASLAGAQAIAGAVREALQQSTLQLGAGHHCADCYVSDMRFLRDPDGETSHGVVTVTSIVSETA